MKTILVTLALLTAAANAQLEDLKPLGLKASCEAKIAKAVLGQCNRDSKNDPDREHDCLLNVVNVVRNQSDSAYFTLLFTVADAVDYNYAVSIENKAACTYKVVNKN